MPHEEVKPKLRRVTMEDVAREAGVSRALVSRAYRGSYGVSSDTKKRILSAGTRLGYQPNRIASQLASKSPGTIGVFLLNLRNSVFADTFDGIQSVLQHEEHDPVLAIGDSGGEGDKKALESLVRSRVGAVIAVGLLASDEFIKEFNRVVPIISATREVPRVDSIAPDDYAAGRLATTHLLQLGHQEILFLSNPLIEGYRGREQGYEATMRSAGMEPRVVETSYVPEYSYKATLQILDSGRQPTAIIAHNDHAALGVLDALYLRGLNAPNDISVIGFDNTPEAGAPRTSLTTVDIHATTIGRWAASAALQRVNDPHQDRILRTTTPSLVARRTSGPLHPRP